MRNKNRVLFLSFFLILLIFFSTVPVSAAQIKLNNGKSLRAQIENDNIKIKTVYAQLNLQSRYLNNLSRKNGSFIFRAAENNHFSGELMTEIRLKINAKIRKISAAEITSIDFSNSNSFRDNKQIAVTMKNGDFFSASTVEDSLSINTSLGSPVNINYTKIEKIEFLSSDNNYLIKRNNSSDIKSDLSSQKIIIWPAAGEIIELDFGEIRKIEFK